MAVLLGLTLVPARARASGGEVVVLYTTRVPEGREVAEHYARKRQVPDTQVIGLDIPTGNQLSRDQFLLSIQTPLLMELQRRGLMTFEIDTSRGPSEPPRYTCTRSSVRYLALTYGIPWSIAPDAAAEASAPASIPPQGRRTEASVDSELALLPRAGHFPAWGPLQNPVYANTNRALLHPTNGVFLVTRLDGPTPDIARRLVDKAMDAEEHGLLGHSYIDLRNITEGAYRTGDEWITNTAIVSRALGFSTFVDNRPETLPDTFPLSHVAIYAGWYNDRVNGPFARPEVEFQPGAIAYHLHSFSAYNLHSTDQNWAGPLLARGATATMGSVHEPYLPLTPNPAVLLATLAQLQFTLGEAGTVCQPGLSWANIVVGDPLYQPFKVGLLELEGTYAALRDQRLEWVLLRKVNGYLMQGRDPEVLRSYLIEQPITTNSAVLSEKVAAMYADVIRMRPAIQWARHALSRDPSPQQRTRLLLNLAEWQEIQGEPADALETLRRVEGERPDYAALVTFRQKQLHLARDAGKRDEVTRLEAVLTALSPPAPPASP